MTNSIIYLIAPIVGYVSAGTLKFIINSIKQRGLAFSEIGLGNFPSTHNCIVSTSYFSIALTQGFTSPISGVALSLCLIVTIDSIDLRNKIESHAKLLNELSSTETKIKTKIGHKLHEVLGGYLLGLTLALILIRL
tara:strand:+ start:386 stop:793 length:408 start_codon:yes stop_codon:yes gene_type:complete